MWRDPAQHYGHISASDVKHNLLSRDLQWQRFICCSVLSQSVISPLFGAELVELLAGSLQQPQTSQVPTRDDEQDIQKKPEHDHLCHVFYLIVHTHPSFLLIQNRSCKLPNSVGSLSGWGTKTWEVTESHMTIAQHVPDESVLAYDSAQVCVCVCVRVLPKSGSPLEWPQPRS